MGGSLNLRTSISTFCLCERKHGRHRESYCVQSAVTSYSFQCVRTDTVRYASQKVCGTCLITTATNRHKHRNRDRQTETKTDREKEREKERGNCCLLVD